MKKHTVIALMLSMIVVPTFAATPKKMQAFPEGDRLVYSRLVQAYRKSDLIEVLKQRNILQKNFPKSVHLDNAFYLSGMLEFQNNRIGESVRSFGVVSNSFRKSNKRAAALFAKGVAYQRLNLQPQAKRVWKSVIQDYPGSPEAQRAWMHLRMAKVSSIKR